MYRVYKVHIERDRSGAALYILDERASIFLKKESHDSPQQLLAEALNILATRASLNIISVQLLESFEKSGQGEIWYVIGAPREDSSSI